MDVAGEGSMHYLGLCAIIKDEGPFLDEWIAYHMHVGVKAFFLYDNGSAVPLRDSLKKFSGLRAKADLVIYDAPGKALQMVTYTHCLENNKKACEWIAFVDADEYIVPRGHDTIPAMLEEFEPYSGLAMNWLLFGSNGHKRRPEGLQMENYTKALPLDSERHQLVKCIVRPQRVMTFFNPHIGVPHNQADSIVTEDHMPINTPQRDKASWDKGQLNHYYYRSKQDYWIKMHKTRATVFSKRVVASDVHNPPEGDVTDTSILRFAGGVKEILGMAG